jgi:hypothetical protein
MHPMALIGSKQAQIYGLGCDWSGYNESLYKRQISLTMPTPWLDEEKVD